MSRITEIREYLSEFTKDSIYQNTFVIKNRTRIFPNRQIEEDNSRLNKIYSMANLTEPYIKDYTYYNFYSEYRKCLKSYKLCINNLYSFLQDCQNKKYDFHNKNDLEKIQSILHKLHKRGNSIIIKDRLYEIYKKKGYISLYLPEKWVLYIGLKSDDYLDFLKCKAAYLAISNILDPERNTYILGIPFFCMCNLCVTFEIFKNQ